MKTDLEIIEQTQEILKGHWRRLVTYENGEYCVLGAVQEAMDREGLLTREESREWKHYKAIGRSYYSITLSRSEVVRALAKSVVRLVPNDSLGCDTVIKFNDDQSHEGPVLETLERAKSFLSSPSDDSKGQEN